MQHTQHSHQRDTRDTHQRDTHQRDTHQRDTRDTHQRDTRDTQHHQRSTALNYLYQDYRKVDNSIITLNTQDILRHLIVRAHDDGQTGLKRCLESTLRAVNLECDFPSLQINKPYRDSHDVRKKTHTKPNNLQRVDEE
jgi:hypothetical protein